MTELAMKEWEVGSQENGLTLLAFLKSKLQNHSSSKLKREINLGQCSLNQRTERFAAKLVGKGDRIFFYLSGVTKSAINLRFLFADEDIIAYDKPSGINSEDKKLLQIIDSKFNGAVLLHRLDRGTSGVLLFARNAFAEEEMLRQFRKRLIKKTYMAVVSGIPQAKAGCIENFLGKLHVYDGQAIWGEVPKEKGVYAKTSWEVRTISNMGKETILTCYPETGRTHQIRVHLASIGHPILGDAQYGGPRCNRLMLHAANVAFIHPRLNRSMSVTAPIPEDFQNIAF